VPAAEKDCQLQDSSPMAPCQLLGWVGCALRVCALVGGSQGYLLPAHVSQEACWPLLLLGLLLLLMLIRFRRAPPWL
jgi:hypothetical protein